MHQAARLLAACSSAKCSSVVLSEAAWTKLEHYLRTGGTFTAWRKIAWLVKRPGRLCEAHPQRCMTECRGITLQIQLHDEASP